MDLDAGWEIHVMDPKLCVEAIIRPYPGRMKAYIPMREEPRDVVSLLDSMPFIGDCRYDFTKQVFWFEWLEVDPAVVDSAVTRIARTLNKHYGTALRLWS